MKPSLDIVYRGAADSSDSLNKAIEQKLTKLEHYTDQPINAHVIIDIPHSHQKKGDIFNVAVDLNVNGQQIAASHTDRSAYDAATHVFDVLQRKIKQMSSRKKSQHHDVNAEAPTSPNPEDDDGTEAA